MAEPLIVSISALRAALLRTLDTAETRLGSVVSLDTDHYWHLPVQDAFNMAKGAPDLHRRQGER